MPPSLAIPSPSPPPLTIQQTGDDPAEQLATLYQLANQLNNTVKQHGAALAQLTHNTHNLYHITNYQQSTINNLNNKTNKILQQMSIQQEHHYSNCITFRNYDSPNFTKFKNNCAQLLATIKTTNPTHQHYNDKQLYVYYTSPEEAFTKLKTLQPQLPPKTTVSRGVAPLMASLRHPSTISYGVLKALCLQQGLQMPGSNTTHIGSAVTPCFSIQLHTPTRAQPNPSMPSRVVISTEITALPDKTMYQIWVNSEVPISHAEALDPNEIKELITERLKTWSNPISAETRVDVTSDPGKLKVHAQPKGKGKGKGKNGGGS
eukprot:12430453-Karenia_brevis.AAC.1